MGPRDTTSDRFTRSSFTSTKSKSTKSAKHISSFITLLHDIYKSSRYPSEFNTLIDNLSAKTELLDQMNERLIYLYNITNKVSEFKKENDCVVILMTTIEHIIKKAYDDVLSYMYLLYDEYNLGLTCLSAFEAYM